MQDGVFVAEHVLAKHDETYMPKEVADKMGMAHKKHDVPEATALRRDGKSRLPGPPASPAPLSPERACICCLNSARSR
jgi:hypothetical protein